MIGSSKSCRNWMRPSSTPVMIPASDPVANPTNTRVMLIATSPRISPLISIGIAGRMTSSGGGMRKGLNKTVDKNCQIRNASISDPTASTPCGRFVPRERRARTAAPSEGLATAGAVSWISTKASPLICPRLLFRHPRQLRRQQGFDFVVKDGNLRIGEVAWPRQVDVDQLGDHRPRSERHHPNTVAKRYCLSNVMRDENDRLARTLPDIQQD